MSKKPHRFGKINGGTAADGHQAIGHLFQRRVDADHHFIHGGIGHYIIKDGIFDPVFVQAIRHMMDNPAFYGKRIRDDHGFAAFFVQQMIESVFLKINLGSDFKLFHPVLRQDSNPYFYKLYYTRISLKKKEFFA